MKGLSFMIQKDTTKLKIFKNRSNSNVKVMKSNIFVPKKRSSSNEYTCKEWKVYI